MQNVKLYLYINTAMDELIELALVDKQGSVVDSMKKKVGFSESEKLLLMIVSLLKGHNFLFSDLRGIIVVQGPGRFTSLRVGVATANTMAFALRIPVQGIKLLENFADVNFVKLLKSFKKGKCVMPMYDREPNITISKR